MRENAPVYAIHSDCRVRQQLVDILFMSPLCILLMSSVVLIVSTVPRDILVSRYMYAQTLVYEH